LDDGGMVDNSFVKDFIHKVRPPDSSPLPLGREAAQFFGSCQVLQRKKCKKRMPQVNWSTLLKHLNCQAGKVTGIGLKPAAFFLFQNFSGLFWRPDKAILLTI
jgi:hypothetical protein